MASSSRKIGMSKWKQGKRRSSRLSGVLDACKVQQSQKMALHENITKGPYDDKAAPSTSYTLIQDQPSSMPEKPILERILDILQSLRDRSQVEQLLQYIIEEPLEDADNKRSFKFPFIACEIFTCEIDVILRTLAEEGELMNLLFSFLEPNRPHSALLAGYFSKVVVCLMLRKTVPLMNYVQVHQDVFCQLVDLIGITSTIMEVLVWLVAADDHVYPNFSDVMQWLADSNLLEMIVDKLSPSCAPEVHANAAETLCAITRNVPSALATKLSSPSFVARIFGHALEDSHSKSGLVNSLSVCILLLDPKRSAINSPLMYSFLNQLMYEPPIPVNSETINAMLPQLDKMSRRTYEYDEDVSAIATSVVIVYCINIFIILTFNIFVKII
ncbi:serine/threonine-protein phosphatase 6 regulatory subunit 3 isoform X4 [Gossypium hirsutum]|uniref:Serine/threonine-protein phosphatase 6 regulatory subunit 3 isoform X4 n=1 Tax=Gossypium hirsutum TaxID=3635 RepID=A0ABM3AYF7_GOSHI|nr:serine/threonine-protein phosphatase 6 regulatory subunit 3-like isoform X4 [Gossypium hirsutum]XP_040959833.1 serine/threonine-protein phosphatase 6 regulatory subunit 3-like isoform X4 [Gossypium hirsutum]